ncbi:heme-dependent oxidative N-demethylase family protein [Phaeobacter sp. C3_T13_0]|uniref:heme-dependent oxidative N-demethylase family protein n=1 Tax=Phaeobacter cretensis TaxID=3342641 RepID=UPI0039BD0D47
MTEILQTRLSYNPLESRKLPGIQPLEPADWLYFDDAFAAQMAERARLLGRHRTEVLQCAPEAVPAAEELLGVVVAQLYPDAADSGTVIRPDGVEVALDWRDPLGTLGLIAQQDFCILEKPEGADEHVLTGAVVCFPANWSLAQKYMRPLIAIHAPVDSYDAGIAARVQRLFDGVQVGRPMWRFNTLWYADASLHQPRRPSGDRPRPGADTAPFIRTERQTILRLPHSRAVVFSIHTSVLAREDVLNQWGAPVGSS